jgi:transposase
MRPKPNTPKTPSEKIVGISAGPPPRHYSAEEKIRIVLDGLRGESSVSEVCRREGIAESLHYSW